MKLYNIGVIVGFHGVRGEVKVKGLSDFVNERLIKGNTFILNNDKETREVKIESVRIHKGMHLLRLEGLNSLNDVEPYKGYYLTVDENNLFDLEEDEHYIFNLVGLEVYTHDNINIGKVKRIMNTPANDILVLDSEPEILIPFLKYFVTEVDYDNNKIVLDEVDGLY